MLAKLREIGTHTVVYGSGLILSKILGFLLIPLYAKYLSTSEYGIMALLDFTVTIMTFIVGGNITDAIMKFYHDADDEERGHVISTALAVVVALSFLGCQLALLASDRFSFLVFGNGSYSLFFKYVFATLFFELILNVPLQYVRVLNCSKAYAALHVSRTVLGLLLNVFFICYLKLGVAGILYTNLLVNGVSCCILLFWLRTQVKMVVALGLAKEMLKFSLPLVPAGIAATCLQSADVFILKHLSTSSQVGIYSFGYKFATILGNVVQTPFALIWGAIAFRIVKERDGLDFVAKIMTYYNLVSVLVGLTISVFIGDVIRAIATPSYFGAAHCVPLVVLGYIFFGMAGIFHLGILANKRTYHSLFVTALAALINILLNLILIPLFTADYKFMAPAINTALSFLMLAFGRWYYATKFIRIDYEFKRLFKLLAVGVAIYFTSTLVHTNIMFADLFLKGCLVLSFPVVLSLCSFYEKREVDHVKRIVETKWQVIKNFNQ